jgi:hypothetical protein
MADMSLAGSFGSQLMPLKFPTSWMDAGSSACTVLGMTIAKRPTRSKLAGHFISYTYPSGAPFRSIKIQNGTP